MEIHQSKVSLLQIMAFFKDKDIDATPHRIVSDATRFVIDWF